MTKPAFKCSRCTNTHDIEGQDLCEYCAMEDLFDHEPEAKQFIESMETREYKDISEANHKYTPIFRNQCETCGYSKFACACE